MLLAQLAKYPETTVKIGDDATVGPVPTEMDELHVFCQRQRFADLAGRFIYDDANEVLFNFGQHKGKKVTEILGSNPGYFGWMMGADFPEYIKKVLRRDHEQMNG